MLAKNTNSAKTFKKSGGKNEVVQLMLHSYSRFGKVKLVFVMNIANLLGHPVEMLLLLVSSGT